MINFNDHLKVKKIKYIVVAIFSISICLAQEFPSVMIDPGHGGDDPGAIGYLSGTTYYEKDLNLQYANNVYENIIADEQGTFMPYQVRHLIDETIEPEKRAEMANNYSGNERDARGNPIPEGGVNVFLSIHCNAGSSEGRGTETIYYKTSDPGLKLATIVHQFFMNSTRPVNSNAKSRWTIYDLNFIVLKNTIMPSIILETEFIQNQTSLAVMITDDFKNAVGDGIRDAFRLLDPIWQLNCWGFNEVTSNIVWPNTEWNGPVLIRNTSAHGDKSTHLYPNDITYYVNDNLSVREGATVVLDDKIKVYENDGYISISGEAKFIIGESSIFKEGQTGIEDCVIITQSPDYLEQNTSNNIVGAVVIDVEPYGNIWDLSQCELYAMSLEGDILLSNYYSIHDPNGYWEFLMNVPYLSQWNNTWIRSLINNEYIRGYFKVINGNICVFSDVLIHSPYTSSGTIQKNEMWCGNISITGDVTVASGIKLVIGPGTNIVINSNKNIICYGQVIATGTSAYPIKFNKTGIYKWNTIDIRKSSQFSYCLFEGGIYVHLKNQRSTFSHVVFKGLTVRTSSSGTFDMTNCIVEDKSNSPGGIYTQTPGTSNITNCTIRDNSVYGIYSTYDGRVKLKNT